MDIKQLPSARLMVELPAQRYRILSPAGRAPMVGDSLALDQSFADDDGRPMVLAYFPKSGQDYWYEAEVYESELDQPDA
ncbi:MAG: hypothetical protein KDA51_09220 [Planctomycetales bacterium]|nr:hypothetical protein [Planctomycetales bacterium]